MSWSESLSLPSVGALSDVASYSTGSVLLDAGVGATLGYLLAPPAKHAVWAGAGAVLGGLGGVFGLGLLGAYALLRR
jgi:hypothetical protein